MLRAEEIVVEPVGFLARQREHLLRARCKITHGFITHTRLFCYELNDLSSSSLNKNFI